MPETHNMPFNMPEDLSKSDEKTRLKKRYKWLRSFDDEELREISLCHDHGFTLKEGEIYFDLEAPQRGIIRARGGERIENGQCLVAKGDIRESTWKKLTQPFEKKQS